MDAICGTCGQPIQGLPDTFLSENEQAHHGECLPAGESDPVELDKIRKRVRRAKLGEESRGQGSGGTAALG